MRRVKGAEMRFLSLMALLGLAAAAPAQRAPVEYIGEPALNGQRLPFSSAVRVGDMLYLSGDIGVRPDGTLPEGIEAQAKQTMENIRATLDSQGLGFRDLVKCTVMLDDMNDWPAFNLVYRSYFPDQRFPARSAFGADGLALGALVELECWAFAGER